MSSPYPSSEPQVGYPAQVQLSYTPQAPTNGSPMQAPGVQAMSLDAVPGVVVRQATQVLDMVMESVGGPYEKENKYVISVLPPGKRAARENKDRSPDVWHPSDEELKALPTMMLAKEESSVGWRIFMSLVGCLNLRGFTMPFIPAGAPPGTELFHLDRKYHCGGCLCDPLQLNVVQNGQILGTVQEDFSVFNCCCSCTTFTQVLAGLERKHRYTLRNSMCCCGRVNNCCAATCCTEKDHIIDILSPEGKIMATIQKVYAPSSDMGACCRSSFNFGNYIVEFPKDASPEDRRLLLGALMHVDYESFQRKGGENNSHDD